MRAEDFSAWLSAIAGLSADQRREGLDALTNADGAKTGAASEDLTGVSPKRASAVAARIHAARIHAARIHLARPAMSGWKAKAARIARGARSSVGAARMGCCGFAARAADARSTP